jgi:hypothetical protein
MPVKQKKENWIGDISDKLTDTIYIPYTSELRYAGSKEVRATIGPYVWVSNSGSTAKSTLPPGIKGARAKYPGAFFKAGHMLNNNLGGNGKISSNLTILTAKANTSMTRLDNRLKDASMHLYRLYEELHRADVNNKPAVAISVKVTVSKAKWGAMPPDCYISKLIKIAANVVGRGTIDIKDAARQKAVDTALGALESAVTRANGKVFNLKGNYAAPAKKKASGPQKKVAGAPPKGVVAAGSKKIQKVKKK